MKIHRMRFALPSGVNVVIVKRTGTRITLTDAESIELPVVAKTPPRPPATPPIEKPPTEFLKDAYLLGELELSELVSFFEAHVVGDLYKLRHGRELPFDEFVNAGGQVAPQKPTKTKESTPPVIPPKPRNTYLEDPNMTLGELLELKLPLAEVKDLFLRKNGRELTVEEWVGAGGKVGE